MVSRALYIIVLTILTGFIPASVQAFSAKLSTNEIELGKYTTLHLTAQGLKRSLKSIDLTPLNENFFVDTTADLDTLNDLQSWKLRLYPRQNGKLSLPSLTLDQNYTVPSTLQVRQARDTKTGEIFHVQTSISETTPWRNQHVRIVLSILSHDPHLDLITTSASLNTGKLQHIELVDQDRTESGQFEHRIGWNYFPDKTGKHRLNIPPVYYRRDGVVTHRFHPPIQQLTVKPLPLYVPGNFQIGKLSLQVTAPPALMLTNRLQHISATLHATGIASGQLPIIENYLHSQKGLQIYPATVKNTTVANTHELVQQSVLNLPVKSNTTGFYQINNINLQYFDPQTGKITTQLIQWPAVLFISPWLLGLIVLVLLVISLYVLKALLAYIQKRYNCNKLRQTARQRLSLATTPQEIKQAIMLFSEADSGIKNTTLNRWQKVYNIDVEPLTLALYKRSTPDLSQLKQPFLSL